jgi:hypothetical protein
LLFVALPLRAAASHRRRQLHYRRAIRGYPHSPPLTYVRRHAYCRPSRAVRRDLSVASTVRRGLRPR